nr:unnamed protein product [Callosobruchus analis]
MPEYPELAVTQYQVAKLLRQAFRNVATVGFAINEFTNDVDFAALLKNTAQIPSVINQSQIERNEGDSSDDHIPKINSLPGLGGSVDKGQATVGSLNTTFEELIRLPGPSGLRNKQTSHT